MAGPKEAMARATFCHGLLTHIGEQPITLPAVQFIRRQEVCLTIVRGLHRSPDTTLAELRFLAVDMTDRKAVVKNADMSEDMQQEAVDVATQVQTWMLESVHALTCLSSSTHAGHGKIQH